MPQEKNDNPGGRRAEGQRESSSGSNQNESSDLKEREYRDKDGNVHHHTRTSREMQDKE